MNKKMKNPHPYAIIVPTVVGGVFALLLRFAMLNRGADWAWPGLWVLSGLMAILLGLLAVRLNRDNDPEMNLTPGPVARKMLSPGLAMGFGGLLLGAASVIALLEYQDTLEAVAAALGVFAGGALIYGAYLRIRGKSSVWAGMLITLFLLVDLISRFRHWSSDPLLEDYCFKLLGCIFAMLGAFHLAGFPIYRGKRRLTVFFSMMAVYFQLLCLGDGGLEACLYHGGLAVWLLAGGCTLRRVRRKPAEEQGEEHPA